MEKRDKEARTRPKSDTKAKAIAIAKQLIEEGRPYLPTRYKELVLEKLGKDNAPEEEKKKLKKAIDNAMAGSNHDLKIAQAIFSVGMDYKKAMEQATQDLNDLANQPA